MRIIIIARNLTKTLSAPNYAMKLAQYLVKHGVYKLALKRLGSVKARTSCPILFEVGTNFPIHVKWNVKWSSNKSCI